MTMPNKNGKEIVSTRARYLKKLIHAPYFYTYIFVQNHIEKTT